MKLMKNVIYLFVASLFLMQSCVKNEENIFNDSAAVRGQKTVEKYREALVSAENGWYVDYYPELNHKTGGYAMYLKFNANGMVDVSCEIETNLPPRQVETSQFEVFMEQGPILSFSTYNKVMHYFSEPSATDINGLEGDYEFIIMKIEPDEIQIKGKKGGNKMTLRRNTANLNPDTHLTEIANLAYKLTTYGMFEFIVDNDSLGIASIIDRTFDLEHADNSNKEKISYAFTTDGIRLYEPFTVNGMSMKNFAWDDSNKQYVCTDQGVNAVLKSYFPPDFQIKYEDFLGKWKLNYQARSSTWLAGAVDTVEIIELKRNVSYLLKCNKIFSFPGLQLTFDPRKGIISIYVFNVGSFINNGETHFIRQCIYDTQSGYYNYGLNGIIGLIGIWNNDENGERKITFEDNKAWGAYKANGLLFAVLNAANIRQSLYTDNIGGIVGIRNLTLTKIN